MQQSTLSRYSTSFVVATLVTAGLLWVMQQAIHTDEVKIEPVQYGNLVPLVRELLDQPVVVKEPEVTKPPVPTPPPVAKLQHAVFQTEKGGFGMTSPVIEMTVKPAAHTGGDGEFLPIMTVAPEYPQRQAARGVEGWVLVEFVVDELGRVREPRIIESYPNSGFDRAALNAVKRYKYKPRVVNGDAVPVSGVRQRIVFDLT